MTTTIIRVKMAEYAVGRSPDRLITAGLGSCVGVAIYDPYSQVGGLIHIMLPENSRGTRPIKYADTGIPLLITEMEKAGAAKRHLIARIAGGAHMFSGLEISPQLRIGDRNIDAVVEILGREGIKIVGRDTGKDYGRTVEFDTVDGRVLIRSYAKGEITI